MRVGLIGDTHDRVPAVAALVQRLVADGAEMLLHVGDFCSPFSLKPIVDANLPLVGVFGRNDGDPEGLRAGAGEGMGIELFESPHSMELAGERILLVHDIGDIARFSVEAHTIVVHGYTHQQEMKERDKALIVNPGEACGWLYGIPSAALIDLDTKRVEFIKLSEMAWTM